MSDDFPAPDGWELAEDDLRPGEPLRPGQNTIVDAGGDPLQQGETITVWCEHYCDGHGTAVCRTNLQVIGDDGDGDIFAIFDEEGPLDASQVFRISSDLSTLAVGGVYAAPEYDHEEGVLTVTRKVSRRSRDFQVAEARSRGGKQDWAIRTGHDL